MENKMNVTEWVDTRHWGWGDTINYLVYNDFAGMHVEVFYPPKKERMAFIIEKAYGNKWLSCLNLRPVDLKRAKSEMWAFQCNREKRGIMSSMIEGDGWSDDIFCYVNDSKMLKELWETGEYTSQMADEVHLILIERALEVLEQTQE